MPSRTLDPRPLASAACLLAALTPFAPTVRAASAEPELVALAAAGSPPRKAPGGFVVDYELVEIFAGEPGRPSLPILHDKLSQDALVRLESGASVLLLADRDPRQRSRWRAAEPRPVSAGLVAALREWSAPPDVRAPSPLSAVLARHVAQPAPEPSVPTTAVPAAPEAVEAPVEPAPDPECIEQPAAAPAPTGASGSTVASGLPPASRPTVVREPPIPSASPVVKEPPVASRAPVAMLPPPASPPTPAPAPVAPALTNAREVRLREVSAATPDVEAPPNGDERLPAREAYPVARVRPPVIEDAAPPRPAPAVVVPAPRATTVADAASRSTTGTPLPPPPPDRLLGPRADERPDLDRPAWFWVR